MENKIKAALKYAEKKKKTVIIPPDEQRCSTNDGKNWRCKNRIADTGIKWCEKHLRGRKMDSTEKKRLEALVEKIKKNGNEEASNDFNGGGSEKSEVEWQRKGKRGIRVISCFVEPRVSDRLKQKKMKKILDLDDHLTVNETTIQQAITNYDASYGIIPDCPPGFTMKGIKAEATEAQFETHNSKRCYEELKSSSAESVNREVELEKLLGHYGSKCLQLSIELEKKKKECVEIQGKLIDFERRKMAAENEFKQLKKTQERSADSRIARLQQDQKVLCQREERAHERITHLEEELKTINAELKHGKRRTEDEIEVWKKKFCDLETRVLSIEKVVQF
ncbi:hypothetical protein MKW94_013420 [Papaver nudicaule]|uniref:WRC domain-containing protein n=1 Tax=Papaver nudicaule TaxID=74823 RepID=A0AA41RX81_PAPNU|nr:hypothetical protein [Papaver nudicaule]MCL7046508.1 hypothetical protein [Papaver nudicaule]